MVINEKALISAVKDAYRNGGYTVCFRPTGHYVICTGFWAVEIQRDNLPREILGLLAQQMGFLPEEYTAYKIQKTKNGPQAQSMIWDTAIAPFADLEEAWMESQQGLPMEIRKTTLTYEGCNVWQQAGNLGIVLVNPEYERIFFSRDNTYLVGNTLYQEGLISKAFVMRVSKPESDPHIHHLAGIQWTAK